MLIQKPKSDKKVNVEQKNDFESMLLLKTFHDYHTHDHSNSDA